MLISLTRQKFEELVPLIPTGAQYLYYWGKVSDVLKRLLITVVGIVIISVMGLVLKEGFSGVTFILNLMVGFYWLWAPIYWASRRNAEYRRYSHCGFWQGQVLDVFISEELIGKEETVNRRGDLVVIENRERRLNLEIGDKTGFATKVQVPLRREHQVIRRNEIAQMLVFSDRSDLSRIAKISDVYIPADKLWVSDYPHVRRDTFEQISRTLRVRRQPMIDVDQSYS